VLFLSGSEVFVMCKVTVDDNCIGLDFGMVLLDAQPELWGWM